jgi:hypothetical protein
VTFRFQLPQSFLQSDGLFFIRAGWYEMCDRFAPAGNDNYFAFANQVQVPAKAIP